MDRYDVYALGVFPAADVSVQMQSSGDEELESMTIECTQELKSGGTGFKLRISFEDHKTIVRQFM